MFRFGDHLLALESWVVSSVLFASYLLLFVADSNSVASISAIVFYGMWFLWLAALSDRITPDSGNLLKYPAKYLFTIAWIAIIFSQLYLHLFGDFDAASSQQNDVVIIILKYTILCAALLGFGGLTASILSLERKTFKQEYKDSLPNIFFTVGALFLLFLGIGYLRRKLEKCGVTFN